MQRYRFNKERKIIISCIKNDTALPKKLQIKILKATLKYFDDYTKFMCVAINAVIIDYEIHLINHDNYYKLGKLIPAFNKQDFIIFCKERNYSYLTDDIQGAWGYNKQSKIEFIKYLIKTYE